MLRHRPPHHGDDQPSSAFPAASQPFLPAPDATTENGGRVLKAKASPLPARPPNQAPQDAPAGRTKKRSSDVMVLDDSDDEAKDDGGGESSSSVDLMARGTSTRPRVIFGEVPLASIEPPCCGGVDPMFGDAARRRKRRTTLAALFLAAIAAGGFATVALLPLFRGGDSGAGAAGKGGVSVDSEALAAEVQRLTAEMSALKEQSRIAAETLKKETERAAKVREEEELAGKLEEQRRETEQLQSELLAAKAKEEAEPAGGTRGGVRRKEEEVERDRLRDRANEMASTMRILAKDEIVRKWGSKPRRVRLDVRFPPDTDVDSYPPGKEYGSVTFEMAPLEAAPHTVHLFLSQVEAKLWDGTTFHQTPPWGVVAEPWSKNAPERENKFREKNLHHASFAEYNPTFPHKRYAVALYGGTGLPKGPAFYISTLDNIYDDPAEVGGKGDIVDVSMNRDPCFATVVEGKDVIDRAFQGKHRVGYGNLLHDPVLILRAAILDENGEGG